MSPSGPTLRTARLVLRPPARDDFDAFAAFCADEEVMRYLGGPQPRSVAWRTFLGAVGSWTVQGFGMFSVFEAASGQWIGRIGAIWHEGWPGTEVGWGLVRAAQGQGYAIEATSAVMDWVVDTLGWTEIVHTIDADNLASRRLAEALGSRVLRLATLPAPFHDHVVDVWGQTADAWRARRRASVDAG